MGSSDLILKTENDSVMPASLTINESVLKLTSKDPCRLRGIIDVFST